MLRSSRILLSLDHLWDGIVSMASLCCLVRCVVPQTAMQRDLWWVCFYILTTLALACLSLFFTYLLFLLPNFLINCLFSHKIEVQQQSLVFVKLVSQHHLTWLETEVLEILFSIRSLLTNSSNFLLGLPLLFPILKIMQSTLLNGTSRGFLCTCLSHLN